MNATWVRLVSMRSMNVRSNVVLPVPTSPVRTMKPLPSWTP